MNRLISLENDKSINIVNKIHEYNAPEKIYIPACFIDQKIKINDYIYKNSYFKNFVTSISGVITGVEEINYNKKLVEALVISNDYKENVQTKQKKIKVKTIDELINLLEKFHLNDLITKIKNIDIIENLLISSIDEECYTAKEFIRLSKNYREIIDTIDILMDIFKLDSSIIATKNTNFKSIKNVKSIIGTYPNIKITLVPDKYLIGKDIFLCKYLNLQLNNTLIFTTNEIYTIYNILNGKEINEILITISGNALKKSIIVNARLGVSLKSLIKEYVKIISEDYSIYINGYLRGYKIDNNVDLVIDNNIDFIVINNNERKETLECINCGACNKICPVDINVRKCFMKKLNNKKCIGCGLCNYICPANIKLKEIVKE